MPTMAYVPRPPNWKAGPPPVISAKKPLVAGWIAIAGGSLLIFAMLMFSIKQSRDDAAEKAKQDLATAKETAERQAYMDQVNAEVEAKARASDPYYDERGPMPYVRSNGLMDVAANWIYENMTNESVVSATPPQKYGATWAQFARIKAKNPFGVFIVRRFEFRVTKGSLVYAHYDD